MSKKESSLLFTTGTKTLREALGKLQSIGGRDSTPSAMMVEIVSDIEGTTLRRITSDARLKLSIESIVESPGSVRVNCESLHSVLSRAVGENVEIAAKDNKLIIRCGNATTRLGVFAEAMPDQIPKGDPALVFSAPVESLKDWLETCLPAAKRALSDKSKITMHGVIFRSIGGELHLCSTDRAAMVACATGIKAELDSTIPTTASQLILSLIAEGCSISFHADFSTFAAPGVEFSTALISGHAPRFDKILSMEPDNNITFDREEMIGALTASEGTSNESKKIIIRAEAGELFITSDSFKDSDTTIVIPCTPKHPAHFGVNCECLKSCLEHMTGKSATLEIGDDTALFLREPGKVQAVGQMRIQGVS